MTAKRIIMIAGPNGAGKTTFARSFLPAEASCLRFINADLIAAGLSPFAPELAATTAARLMLKEMAECSHRGESFGLETTLATRSYIPRIRDWKTRGYRISLVFLSLSSVELALSRVALRVSQGGHSIPSETVRRRYDLGLKYFHEIYRDIVHEWYYFDNSSEKPVLLDVGSNDD